METIGNLVDKLTVVNLKIWHYEDIKRDSKDDALIAKACKATNILNSQRNDLIQEIDEIVNELITSGRPQKLYQQGNTKIYGKQ